VAYCIDTTDKQVKDFNVALNIFFEKGNWIEENEIETGRQWFWSNMNTALAIM